MDELPQPSLRLWACNPTILSFHPSCTFVLRLPKTADPTETEPLLNFQSQPRIKTANVRTSVMFRCWTFITFILGTMILFSSADVNSEIRIFYNYVFEDIHPFVDVVKSTKGFIVLHLHEKKNCWAVQKSKRFHQRKRYDFIRKHFQTTYYSHMFWWSVLEIINENVWKTNHDVLFMRIDMNLRIVAEKKITDGIN